MSKRFKDKTSGIITQMDFNKKSICAGYWAMFAVLVLVVIINLFPILWIILSSFKSTEEFFALPPTLIPKKMHFSKLVDVWKEIDVFRMYVNSLIMASGDLLFSLISNGLCGYVISRLKPKGSKLLFAVILWTMMMPSSLNMVPLFKTFLDFPVLHLNFTDTYFPMWIMSAANCYYILLFKNFFDSIPGSFVEAAKIDGCSNFKIFLRIIIPMSVPIVMVVSIFTVTHSFDNFLWPYLVLKDSSLYTTSVKLYYLKSIISVDKQVVATLFAIIPSAIVFFIFQKKIMDNSMAAGVKE